MITHQFTAYSQDNFTHKLIITIAKKGIHPQLKACKVVDINGYEFEIVSTMEGPLKVETSHLSHPIYNPNMAVKKVVKGRLEQFLEKQKKIDKIK